MERKFRKKFLLISKCIFLLIISNVSYGITSRGTGFIRVEAINTPVIIIDEIDFGDYVIGTAGTEEVTNFTLTNGAAGRIVKVTIPDPTIDLTSGVESCVVTISTPETQFTLDPQGEASGTLYSSLTTPPTLPGEYMGTVMLNVEYN